jgi:hypothetical protein
MLRQVLSIGLGLLVAASGSLSLSARADELPESLPGRGGVDRPPTAAEEYTAIGYNLSTKSNPDFNSAIINFKRATESAQSQCELGIAWAGLRAAQAAKNGYDFNEVLEDQSRNVPDGCFV